MMPHPPALVRHLAVATLLMGFGPIPAHAQAAESCQDAARTREREIPAAVPRGTQGLSRQPGHRVYRDR